MMSIRLKIAFSILFFWSIGTLYTQTSFHYDASVEREFSIAVQLFHDKKFSDALIIFDSLINKHPQHQRTTAAYLMAGKSLYELKRYNASIVLLTEFLKLYPESNYSDEVHFSLGVDYMMLQKSTEAAKQFLYCTEVSSDSIVMKRALELLSTIAETLISINTLEILVNSSRSEIVRDLLGWKLSEKYYRSGEQKKAEQLVDQIINHGTKSIYENELKSLKTLLSMNKPMKIGVILTFINQKEQNPTKVISEEILDGINYALEELRQNHKMIGSINLEIKDDERDTKKAEDAVKELSSSHDVIAIIGPLYSNTTIACIPLAEKNKIPLITPTANASGIAGKSKYVFQLNPDLIIRGKVMAEYAVKQLGMKHIVVLSSTEPNDKIITEAFQHEVAVLGSKVLDVEYYTKGSSDLSDQFLNIRRMGLKLTGKKESVENLKIAVTGIDGLFIPLSDPDDIGMLASQIKYFNIETQLLGTNEWYSLQQLYANRRYLNGLIMLVDTYYDENDLQYVEFKKHFLNFVKKQPTKYSIYGYDTMKMILDKISSGTTTRQALTDSLQSIKSFQGIHGKITLSNKRVNSEFQILKYINNEIQKIGEINIQ